QIEQLGMNNILIRQPVLSEGQSHPENQGLTEEDVEALSRNVPFLSRYASLKVIEASITGSLAPLSPEILAVSRTYGEVKDLSLAEGRFICDLDHQQRKLVCVVGNEVAKKLASDGHVGGFLRIENHQYEIVGILQHASWEPTKKQSLSMRNHD